MSASSSSSLGLSLTFGAVAIALAVGCSAQIEPISSPSKTEQSNIKGTPEATAPVSPECKDKGCGSDCSPAGSDEPFNCDSKGACVATGAALNCKVCPEFVGDCIKGESPADLDGDGCIDGCKAFP